MPRHSLLLLAALLCLSSLACAPAGTGGATDGGATDAGHDAGAAVDGGANEPDAGTQDEDAGSPPSDGGVEVGELPLGQSVSGAITEAGEQDAYRVDTVGARFYRASVTLPAGSELEPHLTVIDDGRDDDPPGADFVQISRVGGAHDADLEFVAAGDGHIVVVRDARNVGGGAGAGSALHTYELRIEEHALADVSSGDLSFPDTFDDELVHAGAIAVYRFEATPFANALFELDAHGDMDGRMMVLAESTGDWIARNDDQAASLDPLIDAPLTEGGVLWLVVDNVEPNATDLRYTLSVDVE